MRLDRVKVGIVGAGPYGLSLATHLRQMGISFRIFGQPMQTWREMPRGMFLKSFGFATKVYTPDGRDDYVTYCQDRNLESYEPCAIADFARYGVWVQKRLVPDVEEVDVTEVARTGPYFRLTLSNGETLRAAQVVIAVGLTHFARWPRELIGLPGEVASHTSQHRGYGPFAGKDVCVIGGGQSAFEAGRLLLEAGARPQLLVRSSKVTFSDKMPAHRSLWERIRRPQSVLGPSLKNWVLENLPLLVHFVPDRWRIPFVKSHLGPHGAWWLRDRIIGKVPILTDCRIVQAVSSAGRLVLRVHVRDAGERRILCDHVVAATGYQADVDRLRFMAADLRASIRRVEQGPALDWRFQSSVPGLYFVGFASSLSFGPLFRFVAGAAYTSRALGRALARGGTVPAEAVTFPISDRGRTATQ